MSPQRINIKISTSAEQGDLDVVSETPGTCYTKQPYEGGNGWTPRKQNHGGTPEKPGGDAPSGDVREAGANHGQKPIVSGA